MFNVSSAAGGWGKLLCLLPQRNEQKTPRVSTSSYRNRDKRSLLGLKSPEKPDVVLSTQNFSNFFCAHLKVLTAPKLSKLRFERNMNDDRTASQNAQGSKLLA